MPPIPQTRKLSWLDHAMIHHRKMHTLPGKCICARESEEHLMYLALMSYYGMFE